jgi:hypothetical protein
MPLNFKHINANEQIFDGSITTSLFAPGAVTVAAMNINDNLTFNENQAFDFRVENVTTGTLPVPGNVGRVVYNTTTGQFLIDNGTAFVPVASAGAVTGVYSDSNPVLTGTIQLISGTNITLSQVGQAITINSVGVGSNSITTVTTTYTANTFNIIQADATTGPFTVTLPIAASSTGKEYTLKKIDSSMNAVTIHGNGAEIIDGSNTQLLNTQWSSLTVISNGTSWIII